MAASEPTTRSTIVPPPWSQFRTRTARRRVARLNELLGHVGDNLGALAQDAALVEHLWPLQPVDNSEPPPVPRTAAAREDHRTTARGVRGKARRA
jgi:hypothetical protein